MNKDEFRKLLLSKKLTDEDVNIIIKKVWYIIEHPEYQKRLGSDFYHHGNMTLGQHIIDDMILVYKYSKKKDANLDLALKIALFHDLYTMPWQNNILSKNKKFTHKHGFTHPIEAVINAYTWFSDDFKNREEAKILIDGIIHHMYPFPVAILDNKMTNNLELNNFSLLKKIPEDVQDIIFDSCNRNKFLHLSWGSPKYLEGKLLSKADFMGSFGEFKNLNGFIALITGKNSSIRK